MPKLVWDKVGERFFETGVKNGVLYPMNTSGAYPNGVVWNGLTGVTEKPSGAESTPLYADDTKYLNLLSAEEFSASLEAYTYPEEFELCDGTAQLADGVTIGQQSRKPFGLVYKTALGNDVAGSDLGYKLHIIYGAQAAPSEKGYKTINDSPEAISFSWELTTTPVPVTGHKPTASLVIDSTKVDAANLLALETILFGDVGVDPRLPMPDEIAALFAGAAPSALTLSTVVPTDAATGIAVASNMTLTFNNKVLEETILVTSAAGALVTTTKTWDATGKILTIHPTSNLSASTMYLVTVAGVVDIYNQTLAPVVKKFTTV